MSSTARSWQLYCVVCGYYRCFLSVRCFCTRNISKTVTNFANVITLLDRASTIVGYNVHNSISTTFHFTAFFLDTAVVLLEVGSSRNFIDSLFRKGKNILPPCSLWFQGTKIIPWRKFISPSLSVIISVRGYAYVKIEYVKIRTYLSKNRIRVWYVPYVRV